MVVEVEKISKRFGDLIALDNLSLSIERGEIYGLLGPNGSGKTTLINCILSLLKFEKGEVKIFGEKMEANRFDLKSKIVYVPQEISILEELNTFENIDFFCGLYIKDSKLRKKYVKEAIEFTGLYEFRKFLPKKLSGGLKRRLNLACGIVHKPEILILDEPTVAIDPQSRNSILEGIKELNKAGTTIIYTTHYIEEVERICSKISIIDKGRLLITGNKGELKKSVGLCDKLVLDDIRLSKENIIYIENIKGVGEIYFSENKLIIDILENMSLANIFGYLKNNDIFFSAMKIVSPTLNDVFLEITGKKLRDS